MSLSVSYNRINNGLDAAALKEVTQQIFQRANSQNSPLANVDLTKFNRVTLGSDFYSGKIDASTASQIAMAKTGMQVTLSQNALNSLKYLSSEASKTVFKEVDGKIAIPETKELAEKTKTISLPSFGRLTEATDLDSNKKGSNPFYKGELLAASKTEENEESSLNVFA